MVNCPVILFIQIGYTMRLTITSSVAIIRRTINDLVYFLINIKTSHYNTAVAFILTVT